MFLSNKQFRLFCFLAGLLTLSGCGGGNDPIPGQATQLIGSWSICRNDGGTDYLEVNTFDGTNGTGTTVWYDSTNSRCDGSVTLEESSSYTYTTGGIVSASLDTATVNATIINANFGGVTFYQIFYIDTSSTPHVLYMGDETAEAGYDGTSEAARPRVLQHGLPRLKL